MRVMCLGAGAIGGYFGGRLIEGGQDVTFIVREGRRKTLLEEGIRIRSTFGDFSSKAKAVTTDEIREPADLVILTCKAYDLDSAIDAISPAVGPQTAVLPLLNGIAHMAVLNARFGEERVLGGLAKIAATLSADGVIQHLNDWRYITFGEQNGLMSDRVVALKQAFDRTSVVAKAVPDIMQEMWNKVVHLATVAGMTTLMRASVGEIARTAEGSSLMIRFLHANAAIAGQEGYAPSDAFLDEYRKLFADRSSGYTASMLRDIERHGPIEGDHIIGFMLRKAREHGIDDTIHRIACTHLEAYEARREAGRL